MKQLSLIVVSAPILISIAIWGQRSSYPQSGFPSPVVPSNVGGSNLPFQPIGASDLLRLTVYDAPELSLSFRVDKQGNLNLPLLNKPIPAAGLLPDELSGKIAAALKDQHLLVSPVVDVSVVEYRSRDVIVAGEVKTPMTIQDLGDLRVLDALSQAGGLLPEAGPEIIVEQANGSSQRLSVRELFDGLHPNVNILVAAGAKIRVPECERVYVVGDVKRPGVFPFLDVKDTTVLQLLALSGGLDSFSGHKAYIYRTEPGHAEKMEIEVPLRRILDRKAEDVKLAPNDILYVPINEKLKSSATVVNHVTGIGNTAVSAAIWAH